MAYYCKKCHRPIIVTYLHGVLETAIDLGDRPLKVNECPTCGNPLHRLSNLNFIQEKEVQK